MPEMSLTEFDNLTKIQEYFSKNDSQYDPLNEYTSKYELLKWISEYICFTRLGFCGCGNMISSVAAVYNYLRIVQIRSDEKFRGPAERIEKADELISEYLVIRTTGNLMGITYELRCQMSREMTEKIFGVKYVTDDPLVQILAYLCDDIGFTEHGSNIDYAWIEEVGKVAMYVLGLRIKYNEEVRALQ